jgi:hypothetical protein
MEENNFEIKDPEEHYGSNEESFSYNQLVMSSLRRYIENSSQEMKEGYWNTKFDRFGNAHKIYVPDSRNELIESVLTLITILEREFDSEISDKIESITKELDKKYKEYLKKEENQWKNLNYKSKNYLNEKGYSFREGYLSKAFPYYSEYILDKVNSYRSIASEILKLIKRQGDFKEELFEA